MEDTIIPYATPHQATSLTARGCFGVIVRTAGLLMLIWGLYTVIYLVGVLVASAPTRGQPKGSFLIAAAFWIAGGLSLLRGEWLVRFAYGGAAADYRHPHEADGETNP